MPFIAIALMIAAALGGGVSVASQSALPGDALWGFKVHVNEQIRSSLAFDDASKAELEISKAQARLEEAQELSADGTLTAENRAKLEANFSTHVAAAQEHIAKLQAKGNYATAAELAARFQASIAKQSSALAQAKVNANGTAEVVLSGLLERVHAALDTASDMSADASAQASVHSSAGASVNTGTSAKRSPDATSTLPQVDIRTDSSVDVGL